MRRSMVRAWAVLVVPLAAPAIVLALLRRIPSLDFVYEDAGFHLVFVSTIAACALLVAVLAARAGARAAHYGPVWLAVGCLWVGLLLVGHGLVTPGIDGRGMNFWVVRLPKIAILGFAVTLVLAARRRRCRTSQLAAKHPVALLAATGAAGSTLVSVIVADPMVLHGHAPVAGESAMYWVAAAVSTALLVHVAIVHWRRWRLGGDPVQLSLVLAAAMSCAALLSLQLGRLWRLSWWDYHGFLLAGFAGAVYAIVIRRRRTSTVDELLTTTFARDPLVHIVDGYPEALNALVRAVEVKDRYTFGHSQRTAEVAVRLGMFLQLDADTLRALARGAFLHDVGKIAIADSILNKPGRLDAEERAVIETHPTLGYELVQGAPSLDEALPVVLHHHERWDGGGYPHGLAGSGIPLIARVAAVADVWDALTSDRSYRAGLSPAEALAHIEAGRSTHFDPRVVDAMVAVAADWGYSTDGEGGGDGDTAWSAIESCHEVAASRV